jgi:hypothetical protein
MTHAMAFTGVSVDVSIGAIIIQNIGGFGSFKIDSFCNKDKVPIKSLIFVKEIMDPS